MFSRTDLDQARLPLGKIASQHIYEADHLYNMLVRGVGTYFSSSRNRQNTFTLSVTYHNQAEYGHDSIGFNTFFYSHIELKNLIFHTPDDQGFNNEQCM